MIEGGNTYKNDSNAHFFMMINKYAAEYYLNEKLNEEDKYKFMKLLKNYIETYKFKLKDKNPEKILQEIKAKIETAMEIYKKITEAEEKLNKQFLEIEQYRLNQATYRLNEVKSNYPDNSTKILRAEEYLNKAKSHSERDKIKKEEENLAVSNKTIIKLFFKHTLNYLNSIENPLDNVSAIKNQILFGLKTLEANEFDTNIINIFNINSEVTKSLLRLRDNLIIIRNKFTLLHLFKEMRRRLIGYDNTRSYMLQKYKENQAYFKNFLDLLEAGKIRKIYN